MGDEAGGVADGVRACGAGRADGVGGPAEGPFHGYVAGGEVDEEFGNEERGYLFGALYGKER